MTDLSSMFQDFLSLISLPDISKWNTDKVIDLGCIFKNCSSLISLPDISKLDTKNILNIYGIFSNCSPLISLHDISKRNTDNVKDLACIFFNCSSLVYLPDISKWNINNVTDLGCSFYKCSSLLSLPDISKWSPNNVTDFSCVFLYCTSLISLPDLSKWNIDNVLVMNGIFEGCISLISFPDFHEKNSVMINDEAIPNCKMLLDINNIMVNNLILTNDLNQYLYTKLQFPHISGLQNLEQNCYINSTIQCLSNISELSYYLLNTHNYYNIDEHPLTIAYINLLSKLLFNRDANNHINPKDFKDNISNFNPVIKGLQPFDSKDLLIFLVQRLHNELKNQNLDININTNNNYNTFNNIEKNKNKTLDNFYQEYMNKNYSIISDIFYGCMRSIIICKNCDNTIYTFSKFFIQIFTLKNIKENKNTKIKENSNSNILNLMDAIIYSQKDEIIEGENMLYCNNCHKLITGKYKQDYYVLPKILIIVLNKGKNNADFNEEFEIPEYIDFTGTNIVVNSNSFMKYYLTSVVKHLGDSGPNGHFITYVRKGKSNYFLCYNDTKVSEANLQDVLLSKISNKENEKITPYILFYHYTK